MIRELVIDDVEPTSIRGEVQITGRDRSGAQGIVYRALEEGIAPLEVAVKLLLAGAVARAMMPSDSSMECGALPGSSTITSSTTVARATIGASSTT